MGAVMALGLGFAVLAIIAETLHYRVKELTRRLNKIDAETARLRNLDQKRQELRSEKSLFTRYPSGSPQDKDPVILP